MIATTPVTAKFRSTESNYIVWTNEKKLLVANCASKFEAYKKTSKTFEKKWQEVLVDCQKSEICVDWILNPPKWEALETAFNRWMKEVLKDAGISEEGANLSGLTDEPDAFISIMLSMAEDKAQSLEEKKKEKEKEERKREAIFTHENQQLANQSKLKNFSDVAIKMEASAASSPDGFENQISSAPSVSSGSSSKKNASRLNPFAFISDVLKEDDRIIDLTVEEKHLEMEQKRKRSDLELEMVAKKFEAEISNEAKKIAADDRRLALEERRLLLEEQREARELKRDEQMSLLMTAILKKF